MKKDGFQARQGDVYIHEVEELPSEVKNHPKDSGNFILAYGEVTGHAHRIKNTEGVQMFEDEAGTLWLRSDCERELTHEEHGTIHIPAGTHKITRQREYTPEKIRFVLD